LCGYKIISRCSGCNLDRSGRSGRNRNTRNRNRIGNCNRNLKPGRVSQKTYLEFFQKALVPLYTKTHGMSL
jgi:hypothetical protein